MSHASRRSAPRRAGLLVLAAGFALAAAESRAATTLEACIDRLPPGVAIDLAIDARIDTTGEGERLSGSLGIDDGSGTRKDPDGSGDAGERGEPKPEYVDPFLQCVRGLLRQKYRDPEPVPERETPALVF